MLGHYARDCTTETGAGMQRGVPLNMLVFTCPVTVGGDARYIGAGPGRLHLNACVYGGIESIA